MNHLEQLAKEIYLAQDTLNNLLHKAINSKLIILDMNENQPLHRMPEDYCFVQYIVSKEL